MVKQGIWKPINCSQWSHGLVTVPKSNGEIRLTTDLTNLNKFVIPDKHPVPNLSDILLELRGAKYFTNLDLKKGYFHIELDEESIPLTTTITPSGTFAYLRLPMGLTDASSVFQKAV